MKNKKCKNKTVKNNKAMVKQFYQKLVYMMQIIKKMNNWRDKNINKSLNNKCNKIINLKMKKEENNK